MRFSLWSKAHLFTTFAKLHGRAVNPRTLFPRHAGVWCVLIAEGPSSIFSFYLFCCISIGILFFLDEERIFLWTLFISFSQWNWMAREWRLCVARVAWLDSVCSTKGSEKEPNWEKNGESMPLSVFVWLQSSNMPCQKQAELTGETCCNPKP